jgi:hypothetical protein
MFPITSDKIKCRRLPIITGNYHVVLFDDVPILFTGTNSFGGYIIGSSIDEDYEQCKEWYLHIVVTKEEFLNYTQGKVTYRNLLERSDNIYVLEKQTDTEKQVIYEIELSDIPEDYRPLDSSYYPSYKASPTMVYEASLLGGIADRNRATPEDASDSHNATTRLLRNALEWLHQEFNLSATVFAAPTTAGSFNINYELALSSNLLVREDDCLRFINAYITYLLGEYPNEVTALVQSRYDKLTKFNDLFDLSQSIGLQSVREDKDLAAAKAGLAKNIYNSTDVLYTLTKNIGVNYQKFSISNITIQGERSLGVVDTGYKEQIRIALAVVTEATKEPVTALIPDMFDRTYKIHVYDFNKKTGNGLADVRETDADEGPESKEPVARLHVRNFKKRGALFKYTESLHEGTYISVIGKAKRRLDGTIEEIEVNE